MSTAQLLAIGLLALFTGGAGAPQSPVEKGDEVRCQLEAAQDGSLAGTCNGDRFDEARVSLARSSQKLDAFWSGSIGTERNSLPVEVAIYQYGAGPRLILRSELGWYLISQFTLHTTPIRLTWSSAAEASPSDTDLRIIWMARSLLSTPAVWDREDDRVCEEDDPQYSV